MDSTTLSPFAQALADNEANANTVRHERAILQAHRKVINQLLHKLAGYDSATVYTSGLYTVTVTVTLQNLDGFNAPRLMRALEPFAGPEWKASTSDSPMSLNRDYRFTMPSPHAADLSAQGHAFSDLELRVVICAYARNDSPTCRKVLVGKKRRVTTEKVYAMECH